MALLTFDGNDFEVGDEVRYTVELLKTYGAKEGVRSNHKVGPRVVFDLPGGRQVMVPFNPSGLVVVLSDRTADGASLLGVLTPSMIKSIYPDKKAGTFLLSGKAPTLTPSARNKVVRLQLTRDELRLVLDLYLGVAATAVPSTGKPASDSAPVDFLHAVRERTGRSLEDLLVQLDRNNATGNAGEAAAMKFEANRLRDAGCPDPKTYVRHVALTDVGRGYDIESTWPGHERCIEVKSTTRQGSDIYLSANELEVLEKLADKAWLYRVLVKADGSGVVIGKPLKNPVPALKAAGMTTAVWRAPDPAAAARQNDE